MIAGCRHTRHFDALAATSAAGDHGADLDHVSVVEPSIARSKRAVADHEERLAVHSEAVEQLIDGTRPWHLHLALGLAQLDDHPTTLGHPAARRRARRASGPYVRMSI